MPYTIFLEMLVNVSVTLEDLLGHFMCVAEQLLTKLQVLQYSYFIYINIYIYNTKVYAFTASICHNENCCS